jgi:DNA mismatch repair protein MutS
VAQLARGLQQSESIRAIAVSAGNDFLKNLGSLLDGCPGLVEKIHALMADSPPAVAAKGGIIRPGASEELDKLRLISNGGKQYLAELQQKEAEATGISSLKISYNNVFGYYLEVTHAHRHKVPSAWMRKQTLANAERFITPELKEYEEKITGAEEKILELELGLYDELLKRLQAFISPMQQNGQVLATIDCLICFAGNAIRFNYKKPDLHDGYELALTESRHPVIERNLAAGEDYIANDILLDPGSRQIIILTGPNMSGKSALLRQTALITLMAHMGGFVPAATARVPLTDKIFTRVGASDNLSAGESTFMVEMNETASILNNITPRSLIILDEIGRGTSTYDGISIAWSIAEYLHQSSAAPKTLFATHYHELNELENKCERIKNFHITSKQAGNKIIFLRKLAAGGSTHSFGIHVARMAGMPPSLIQRANAILKQLEESRGGGENMHQQVQKINAPQVQLSIFDAHSQLFGEIRKLLEELDINRLTPVEALLKLNEIKGMLQ